MRPTPPPLIANLAARLSGARVLETHISWVLIADEYAYKIKKPVNLGFLDFSTLDKRHVCCLEEIRLNRRLAPGIYLEVIAITGSETRPELGGAGPVLEWAVKMRAFPVDSTLDLAASLDASQIDAIAERVAMFHQTIACAPPETAFGTPEQARAPMRQNFSQLRALEPPAEVRDALSLLDAWAETEGQRLAPHFAARKAGGFIRECHGDLHLGNIAWVDSAPLIFDGIEFNAELRFIDVISEMAFLAMDLCHRGRADLAWRALNRYLEYSGDYAGLAALRYYMVYRAMVRAKVAAIRARQADANASGFAESLAYLNLAASFTRPPTPALVLMHGVSGSGKTVLAQYLLERLQAIRLRSDVERKRLFGLPPLADSSTIPGGIYTREAGTRTLQRLLELARKLLADGFLVIVDATFLTRDWRTPFSALAQAVGVKWCWVSPQATPDVLRTRVAQRAAHGGDASEAGPEVLEAQLRNQDPLDAAELAHCVHAQLTWTQDDLINATRAALDGSASTPSQDQA